MDQSLWMSLLKLLMKRVKEKNIITETLKTGMKFIDTQTRTQVELTWKYIVSCTLKLNTILISLNLDWLFTMKLNISQRI